MKIRTRGKQAFNVPNTEEGHVFLKLFRKFRNRGWHYRARGRGSRQEHGDQGSIEQEYAEWLAVYMTPRRSWDDLDPLLEASDPRHETLVAQYNNHDNSSGLTGNPSVLGVPPAGTFNMVLATWSAPILSGEAVALAEASGRVYSPLPGSTPVHVAGIAVSPSQGNISAGEGTVEVQIPETYQAPPAHQQSSSEQVINEILATPTDWLHERGLTPPQAPADDSVELTQEEQIILEKILLYAADEVGHGYEGRETLDSLINKLVD